MSFPDARAIDVRSPRCAAADFYAPRAALSGHSSRGTTARGAEPTRYPQRDGWTDGGARASGRLHDRGERTTSQFSTRHAGRAFAAVQLGTRQRCLTMAGDGSEQLLPLVGVPGVRQVRELRTSAIARMDRRLGGGGHAGRLGYVRAGARSMTRSVLNSAARRRLRRAQAAAKAHDSTPPPCSGSFGAEEYAVGRVLAARYRIEHLIGIGSMGVVLAARHIELDTRVAIKAIRPEMLALPGVVSRFAREAKAAVVIRSEHVAQVFDVGTDDELGPYIVMEHLEGRDLRTVLDLEGRVPLRRAVDYVLQAC